MQNNLEVFVDIMSPLYSDLPFSLVVHPLDRKW